MEQRRLGLAGLWGIAGVVALLAQAIYKLVPFALELFERDLTVIEVAVLVVWLVMSAYSEGYRGFQLQFSPRVVARAQHLTANARPLHVALAPLYCMGLVHATRKRLIASWVLTLAIVLLVIAVRHLAQPWRGIVDAGVVLGLGWGLATLAWFTARGARGLEMPVPADVPTAARRA